jgi:hypothetical protein
VSYTKQGPFVNDTTPALNATRVNAMDQGIYDATTTVDLNSQSGTTYTLVLTDAGKMIRCTNASAVTVTIPLNATVAFPTGTVIEVRQAGAGQVTISPTGGVTLNSESSMRKTAAQYRGVSLIKVGTDTWDLDGSLVA